MGASRASSHRARWVAALFVLLGSRALAQPVSPADEILSRPASAGATALLIEYLNVPAVQVRLGQALRDSSAAVRAAAARVLFAAGAKGFAAHLALAFAAETAEDPAVEQARFLIYFGPPESRAAVQAAWPRVRAWPAHPRRRWRRSKTRRPSIGSRRCWPPVSASRRCAALSGWPPAANAHRSRLLADALKPA